MVARRRLRRGKGGGKGKVGEEGPNRSSSESDPKPSSLESLLELHKGGVLSSEDDSAAKAEGGSASVSPPGCSCVVRSVQSGSVVVFAGFGPGVACRCCSGCAKLLVLVVSGGFVAAFAGAGAGVGVGAACWCEGVLVLVSGGSVVAFVGVGVGDGVSCWCEGVLVLVSGGSSVAFAGVGVGAALSLCLSGENVT